MAKSSLGSPSSIQLVSERVRLERGVSQKSGELVDVPGTSDSRFRIGNILSLVPGTFAPNFGRTRGWRDETGDWRLETRDWRLET